MTNIQKIESYTKWLDKALEFTAFFCLIVSVAFAIFNVGMRFFFDTSYALVEEICRYTIIYGTFLYLGPLVKKGEHIKMDLMSTILKGKLRHLNELIISIILFIAFAILFWASTQWVMSLFQMKLLTSSGTMLMVIPTISVPIGMFFASLYSIQQIIIEFSRIRVPKITPPITEQKAPQEVELKC